MSRTPKFAEFFAETLFVPCRNERVETIVFAGRYPTGGGQVEEFIARLNEAGARYLLIGGQAVRLHGLPRFSMDWDFLVPSRDEENFARINAAVGKWLGEPLIPLGPRGENFVQTYQIPMGVVQFHLGIPGIVSFDAAEAVAVDMALENGIRCLVLSVSDLLRAKIAVGRSQDQIDIEFLRERERRK